MTFIVRKIFPTVHVVYRLTQTKNIASYGNVFSDDTLEKSLLLVTGKIVAGGFLDPMSWQDINDPIVVSNPIGMYFLDIIKEKRPFTLQLQVVI